MADPTTVETPQKGACAMPEGTAIEKAPPGRPTKKSKPEEVCEGAASTPRAGAGAGAGAGSLAPRGANGPAKKALSAILLDTDAMRAVLSCMPKDDVARLTLACRATRAAVYVQPAPHNLRGTCGGLLGCGGDGGSKLRKTCPIRAGFDAPALPQHGFCGSCVSMCAFCKRQVCSAAAGKGCTGCSTMCGDCNRTACNDCMKYGTMMRCEDCNEDKCGPDRGCKAFVWEGLPYDLELPHDCNKCLGNRYFASVLGGHYE